MGDDENFFEEDEPVDDLLAEFDRAAERGTTQRPVNDNTHWLNIFGLASGGSPNRDRPTPNTVNLFAA